MTIKIIVLLLAFVAAGFPVSAYRALEKASTLVTSGSCVDELLIKKDPYDPLGYSILGIFPITLFGLTVIAYILAHYMALRYMSHVVELKSIGANKVFWTALHATKWIFLVFTFTIVLAFYKIVESGGLEWVVMLALSMATLSIALFFASITYTTGMKIYLAGKGKEHIRETLLFFFYILAFLMVLTSALMIYVFTASYLHHLNYLRIGDTLQANLESIRLGQHFSTLFSTFMVLDTAFTVILGMTALTYGDS